MCGARRARADHRESAHGADGEEQFALGLRGAGHRGVRAGRSGRTETFKIAAGILKRDFFHGGEIVLRGRPMPYLTPAPAVRDGIAYVTEDRKVEGFFETMSIARNVYIGLLAKLGRRRPLFLPRGRGGRKKWVDALNVRAIRPGREGRRALGRQPAEDRHRQILVQEPTLIVFDEPTRGVDVGAIAEIHQLIDRLAEEAMAVVMISSYLPEIMARSDRILVCRQGKVVEEFSARDATEEKIMYAAIH
jgi:simple sugar transport system ATP-binding protein